MGKSNSSIVWSGYNNNKQVAFTICIRAEIVFTDIRTRLLTVTFLVTSRHNSVTSIFCMSSDQLSVVWTYL